jgi:hypothetical protein
MTSTSYTEWCAVRTSELDEIARAHAAVGGTARGRRCTTQQINRAYAVLLASHFQGLCRDLHSECVHHLLGVMTPAVLRNLARAEFTRGRQLDRGNARPSSLGADFGRLGIDLWDSLKTYDPASTGWKDDLELLNDWRNAIAHQDFSSPKLGGATALRLAQVEKSRAIGRPPRWTRSCVSTCRC